MNGFFLGFKGPFDLVLWMLQIPFKINKSGQFLRRVSIFISFWSRGLFHEVICVLNCIIGSDFDCKLTWKERITEKRKQLDHKTREIQWLLPKHSPLSLENKLLMYKMILNPIWTYGIVLWGCASKSNIAVKQRYQSKILRTIINAPWYVTNQTLRTDLQIPFVHTVFHKHCTALASNPNPLLEPMLHPEHNRRLNWRWTFDTTNWGDVIGRPPRPLTQPPGH
jgi:hypothetical protein